MSYHIDSKTMLFDKLTKEEALDLDFICRKIVLFGEPQMSHPAFIAWCKAADYNETQALMVHATAFPQRALISIVNFWRDK